MQAIFDEAAEPGTRIFGYGSLLWNPGFAYEQKTPARLIGHRRAFCRLSVRHRGTPEHPGMVVGLAPGGHCDGLVFEVSPANRDQALEYLDAREGAGYRRELVTVEYPADPGRPTEQAFTYLPEESHPTYAPDLSWEETVRLIRDGQGQSGRARDYLAELVRELERLSIAEPEFRRMLAEIEAGA